jgi:hypothetical protein
MSGCNTDELRLKCMAYHFWGGLLMVRELNFGKIGRRAVVFVNAKGSLAEVHLSKLGGRISTLAITIGKERLALPTNRTGRKLISDFADKGFKK